MKTLQVRIVSPEGEVFKEEALSVSSKNSAGNFDVLAEHANFITLVENQTIVVIKANKEKVTFKYPLAILHAGSNKVDIYTDISKLAK